MTGVDNPINVSDNMESVSVRKDENRKDDQVDLTVKDFVCKI